jgi:hypothetical protein
MSGISRDLGSETQNAGHRIALHLGTSALASVSMVAILGTHSLNFNLAVGKTIHHIVRVVPKVGQLWEI